MMRPARGSSSRREVSVESGSARGRGKRESDDEQRHAWDVFHGFATVTVTLPLPVAPALSRTVTTRVFVPFVPLVVTHGRDAGRSPLVSFQTCVPPTIIV